MTTSETFLTIATDGKFSGPRARRDALVATLREIAEVAGHFPDDVAGIGVGRMSITDAREGLEAIAGAYPGALAAGAGEPGAPAILARARTVREMLAACEGYSGFVDKLDALNTCAAVWDAIAASYAKCGDARSQAIAKTWSREAGFLRAAYEVLDV